MAIKPSSQYNLSYNDQTLWDRGDLSIKGIRAAWQARRDPRLAEYIVKLVQLDPALPKEEAKTHQNKFSYGQLVDALRPWTFSNALYMRCNDLGISLYPGERNKEDIISVIASMHRDLWIQVEETPEAMPDRLKLADLLLEMWSMNDAFTRESLLKVMSETPLKYGPWKAMKRIFKESIERQDWVMFGTIAARLDREGDRLGTNVTHLKPTEPFSVPYRYDNRDVSKRTIRYILRRAWRALRGLAQDQPNLYLDAVAQVLKHYQATDNTWNMSNAWLRNHILFHQSKSYGPESFYFYPRSPYYGKQAYPELWKLSEQPLVRLFEEAKNELVIQFTIEALIEEYKSVVEGFGATWISNIATQKNHFKDKFLYQWFTELCPHPQHDYEQHSLHRPLLKLLWSVNDKLATYALTYFKAHPSSLLSLLTIDQSIAMVRSSNRKLRELGESLLDPAAGHFKLSLEQWTDLLGDENSFDFASTHFINIFSGKDLSYSWYSDLINHELNQVSSWAINLLNDSAFKPISGDLLSFYWSLLSPSSWRPKSSKAAFDGLTKEVDGERLLGRLGAAQLRALLLHPNGSGHQTIRNWVKEGWVSPHKLGVQWLKLLIDKTIWNNSDWSSYLEDEGADWKDTLEFNTRISNTCRAWLLNPKFFTVDELGAWWLFSNAFASDWSGTSKEYLTYIKNTLPLAHFKVLEFDEDTPLKAPSKEEGFQALLYGLCVKKWDANQRFILRNMFIDRVEVFNKEGNPNAKALSDDLSIDPKFLTFKLFTTFAQAKDEQDRKLALRLGKHFYRDWTNTEGLTFDDLLPFFEKGYPEVQDHLLKAMSATPLSAEARIDVREAQFDPNGLYAFCFSAKAQVRDLGLTLIGEHPERFAHPEKISLLVESSDRRVCEGVVKLLWEKLRFKSVSTPWTPHEQSVSPRSKVAKKQVEVVVAKPPTGKKATDMKGRRYLGEGTKSTPALPVDSLTWVAEFLTRTLFRLSPTHPLKGDLGRLTSAMPSWRNKVSLIKAIRDVAVKDEGFADLVKPILEEFMASRGRSERAACLVALTRMRAAHPHLFG